MEDFDYNTTDEIHVLFIEGFCQVPWFQNEFWKCPQIRGIRPFDAVKSFRVWCTDPSYLDYEGPKPDIPPDAYGIDKCIAEIESGKYHAIVVVDYSNPDDVQKFDEHFGQHLHQFVADGGVTGGSSVSSSVTFSPSFLFVQPSGHGLCS